MQVSQTPILARGKPDDNTDEVSAQGRTNIVKSVQRGSQVIPVLACLFTLWGSMAPEAHSAEVGLTHGPLAGAVRPTAVTIWVRTNSPAEVQVEYSTALDFLDSVLSQAVETDQSRDSDGKVARLVQTI